MKRSSLAVLVALLAPLAGLAGALHSPPALGLGMRPPEDRASILIPGPDAPRLLAEDAAAGRAVPLRVGVPRRVGLAFAEAAGSDAAPDGGTVGRISVHSPGALWLSFVFSGYALPEGAALYAYAPDGSAVLGPFTSSLNRDSGLLATPVLPGDTAVIELDLPPGAPAPALRLETAVAGYRPLGAPDLRSGDCEVDVNCPEGADWQDDKRAVAMIYFEGYLCTGTLLNNVRGDCRNYFLTANHCINREETAETTIFYWNFEREICGEGYGSARDHQTGALLRATNSRSDFTLLELAEPPDPEHRPYYAGWSASKDAPLGATGIHHPDGDEKKISFEFDRLSGSNPSFWRVPHWEVGVTEPGSSGSALWNPDHQVIGQLSGGASACDNPPSEMWDEYGKFSASWSSGANSASRLRDWLDPDGTGIVSIPGKDGTRCQASPHARPVTPP